MCGLYQSRYLNPLVYQRVLSCRRGEVDIMSVNSIPKNLGFLNRGGVRSLVISRLCIGLLLSVKEWLKYYA